MTFTVDNENSISAFATAEEAAAATQTPFDSFASEKELAELIAAWPPERLVATWNSLPGVVALKSLPDTKAAKDRWAKRIWARIQDLGEAAQPETEATQPETAPAKPKAGKKATGRTVRQGRTREGQGDQEGHRSQEGAQSQDSAHCQENR